ncbi:DUF742 domain-containing protein [Actinocrispum sp. NPDC049592]|uniref:DUF742 domain-containing protein n=1 Tax=Actinocrispum sp. NPDC049592 TaxID=3154835 RepID=UPI00344056BC
MGADEDTFADVLNGLTQGIGRRKRRNEPEVPAQHVPEPVPHQDRGEDIEDNAASVRAYAWTGGRTRPEYRLRIETLVSASAEGLDRFAGLSAEHQEVIELCTQSRSVAEVGAVLRLPLGVVKVLLGDMARLGLITVYENDSGPDLHLLERVLHGLTRLRT